MTKKSHLRVTNFWTMILASKISLASAGDEPKTVSKGEFLSSFCEFTWLNVIRNELVVVIFVSWC